MPQERMVSQLQMNSMELFLKIFQCTQDARLQKQARFINQFSEGLIWRNVVIVAKQPGIRTKFHSFFLITPTLTRFSI